MSRIDQAFARARAEQRRLLIAYVCAGDPSLEATERLVPALVLGDAALRHDLLWRQSADRITGAIGHGRPFWFLLALLPVLLFPWGWSWRVWAQMPAVLRGDRAAWFCALWAVAALVMFTLPK